MYAPCLLSWDKLREVFWPNNHIYTLITTEPPISKVKFLHNKQCHNLSTFGPLCWKITLFWRIWTIFCDSPKANGAVLDYLECSYKRKFFQPQVENYYNSCLAGKITTCRIIPGWEILATRVDVVVVVIVVNIVVVVVAVVIQLLSILIGGFGVAEGKLKISY